MLMLVYSVFEGLSLSFHSSMTRMENCKILTPEMDLSPITEADYPEVVDLFFKFLEGKL